MTTSLVVTYSSIAVMASSAKRLLLALLVQAVLIGHAVCICSPLAKFEAGASDDAGCPLHRAAVPSDAAQPASPHDSDPSCPHCGTQAVLSTASADAIAVVPALHAGAAGPLSTSAVIASLDRAKEWRSARAAEVPVLLPPLLRNRVLQI